MPKFVNSNDSNLQLKAVKEFTDREEPRKVFWEKYNKMDSDIKGNGKSEKISVISYYGFGGIGKSTLLLKIDEEIKKKEPNTKIEFVDFEKLVELNNNTLEILKAIRQDLKQKYNFTFPIFDLVVYVYETKLGKEASKPEIKSILEENKELNFLLDVAGEIPLLGTVTKIVSLVDKGKNIIQERLNDHKLKDKLLELESQSIDEIKEQLQYYFAIDLAENIKKENSPFVFIIDTYEKLVNELSSVGNPLDNDLWLRGEKGLILNVPNTLWVIAGREKLKWEEIDIDWKESLEQHLLGTLSFTDTKSFLETAGIQNEELIHQLYDLTHGSPIYLDMCVDTYVSIKSKGQEVSIENFGEDTTKLIKRFLMYMNDTERDFSTMLAYIPSWTDETIEETAMRMNGSFSFSLYEKVKNFSFIVNENGKYKMNDSIRDIIIANTPNTMRQKFLKIAEEETNKKLDRIIEVEENKVRNLEEKENKAISYINKYESRNAYESVIENLINDLCKVRDEESFKRKTDYLIQKIETYETRFDMPINLEKKNQKCLSLLEQYKDTAEYIKLSCFSNLDISSTLKNSNLLGKHGLDILYPVKRFLRYTEKEITDIARFEELYDLLKNNKDLYYIRLLSLAPHKHPKYEEYQQECNDLINKYKDKPNTFYIEILLNSFEKLEKNNDKEVNKEEKDTYNSLDSIFEEYNKLFAAVNDLASDIESDANMFNEEGISAEKRQKAERIDKIIKAFQENPKLLTAKILNSIFELSGYDLDEGTRKKIFDYLYSIKYIALNSSEIDIIDSFYNIFKDYLGGEYNISNKNTNNDEIFSKAIYVIEQLKDKYIELYGDESYVVNEAEIYILKHKIKDNPNVFDIIMEKNINKFGVVDYKTEDTLITLTKEINNYLEEDILSEEQRDSLFKSLIKYGNKIIENFKKEFFENDEINIHTQLISTLYSTLVKFHDLITNKQVKKQYLNDIYNFCYKTLPFYNDKGKTAKELSCLFDFTEKYMLYYSDDESKIDEVINLILDNQWTNPCLEGLIIKYIIQDLHNEIRKHTEESKKKVTKGFYDLYEEGWRVNEKSAKEKVKQISKMKWRKSSESYEIEYYNTLIAETLLRYIRKDLDKIKESYYKLFDFEKPKFSEEDPIFLFCHLGDVLKKMVFVRPKFGTCMFQYDLYGYYLNLICTISGNLNYSAVFDYYEKNKKKKLFNSSYDANRIERLNKLNNTLIYIRMNANGGEDRRFKDVAQEYGLSAKLVIMPPDHYDFMK